jgi:Glycosyl transferases group 1
MTSRLRIIVTGTVGLYPVGGVAWDYFQYVIGLARLGHDVYYHEDTWCWPYHPVENRNTSDGRYSAKFIDDFFQKYAPELRAKWHYLHMHEKSFGMPRPSFDKIAQTADLFINVSGNCFIPDRLSPTCVKVFLDTDPGYNQIMLSERFAWSENVDRWCSMVREHDQHFTNAENINGPDCLIPLMGFKWTTTGRPVVMTLWNPDPKPAATSPWTTVMTWNAFKGKLVYRGVEYKSKGNEFEKLIELPRRVRVPLNVAVGGVNAPLKRLASYGWDVLDGPSATLTPADYQDFVARSRGEFSIAKHVYVAMQTGWFSFRSACYLAAGRPVVVQDTGFSKFIPTGKGLLAFATMEEAVDAILQVEADYERHAKAARALAESYFDSDKVLSQLIKEAMGLNRPQPSKMSN